MSGLIEPRVDFSKFFLQVSTREREIFATEVPPAFLSLVHFFLIFLKEAGEGRPSQKVLEVGGGALIPKKGPGMRGGAGRWEGGRGAELEGRDGFQPNIL